MEGPTARTVVHLHGGHVGPESDGYPEQTILPGQFQTFHYPNGQLAATLWYHDHAIGTTRLNVMMGLAGFYLIRDAEEAALNLPADAYEIPLVIQDRTLKADGSLRYPDIWREMFFGDKAVVNGKVWPYLKVLRDAGRYPRPRGESGSSAAV
jgi:spore coat protein A